MEFIWIISGVLALVLSFSQIFGLRITAEEKGSLHEQTIFALVYLPFILGVGLIALKSFWVLLIFPIALVSFFLAPGLIMFFPIIAGAMIGRGISIIYFDSEYKIISYTVGGVLAFVYCSYTRGYTLGMFGNLPWFLRKE